MQFIKTLKQIYYTWKHNKLQAMTEDKKDQLSNLEQNAQKRNSQKLDDMVQTTKEELDNIKANGKEESDKP